MPDFIIRLFCRWHHNLIVSSCCNYGVPIPKEVYDSQKAEGHDFRESLSQAPGVSCPPDEIYYDAIDEISSQS